MTETGKITRLFGLEMWRSSWITEKHKEGNYHAWKFVAFKLFMFTMGYSTLQGDSIIIRLGITKLETFFSFTIKDRWTR
jgi:hypothetical protein